MTKKVIYSTIDEKKIVAKLKGTVNKHVSHENVNKIINKKTIKL